jgi:hypothetical protein
LHIEVEPWLRIGRPVKYDLAAWRVIDDWPVTNARSMCSKPGSAMFSTNRSARRKSIATHTLAYH